MSKKFKSQASSARAVSNLTGGFGSGSSFRSASSSLSYVTELPDLSQISEPNTVVAFKNLGKKDSTTKAKALEDLQENLNGDIAEGVLQAWADVYPRTSIDNSRRVRQLAHSLQGSLTIAAGKRIAPTLPKVIGSWLAGTFDSDRSVSRTAQDALERSFRTAEKRRTLWSLYRDQLLSYIEDAILMQTATTLSDERTTHADDAQAKYVRVVGTAMHMLVQFLKEGIQTDFITTLLGGKKLWEFIYHNDFYLRRSTCDLILIAGEKNSNQLDWAIISTCFLSKGLHADQQNSSKHYTAALLALTKERPELWTTDYTAKTAISKRLLQFLRQGSQNGPEETWTNIASLIRLIPEQVWRGENQFESSVSLADALHTGVVQPAERINAAAAWATYVQTCLWLTERLSNGQTEFVGQQLLPIVEQYVTKKQEDQWTINTRAVQICKVILTGILRIGLISAFERIWLNLISTMVDQMKLSQPETSKNFQSSQDAVISQAKRLFEIKSEIVKSPEAATVATFLTKEDETLLYTTFELLRSRNGKPYCAAGIVEIIAAQSDFKKDNKFVQAFLKDDLPALLTSPSSEKLVSTALKCGQSNVIVDLLAVKRSSHTDQALCYALRRVQNQDLSNESNERVLKRDLTDLADHQIIIAVMQNPALKRLHSTFCEQIRQSISTNASISSQQAGLTLLEKLLAQPESASTVTSTTYRSSILSNLLVLVDAGSDLSEKANAVVDKFNSSSVSETGTISIIQQQLNGEGVPLSIFTLTELANGVAQHEGINLTQLLPTSEMWTKALAPHISSPRPYSLSITSPLHGLIYMVDTMNNKNAIQAVYDQDDFSIAFRLILYTTKILSLDLAARFASENLQIVYNFYPLALQFVSEKLTVDVANELWIHSTPEVLQEAADTLSDGNKLIQSWLKDDVFTSYWLKLLHQFTKIDLMAYMATLAWTNIAAQHVGQIGPSQVLQEYGSELRTVHKSGNSTQNAALLAVLQDYITGTPHGKRVMNELVAYVTELKGEKMKHIILLNIMTYGDSGNLDTVPSQRLVFLLKSLVHLSNDRETAGIQAEAIKLLVVIVPLVQDVYGEHWEQIFNNLVQLWSTDVDLPAMNASVRLYAQIKRLLKNEDVNEDMKDAWTSAESDLRAGLLECLKQLGRTTNDTDQPRTITAELVRRHLHDAEVQNDEEMYTLLSSPVEAVQITAYEILHRTIPQRQEKISVELILAQQTVQLPTELMQLLADQYSDPRRYMLAWKLVFDHYTNASYKLRDAYTEHLKQSGHIGALLEYICQEVGLVSGRPIDVTKYDIANFNVDEADSAEKELLWLVVHVYYSTLLHVPGLAKEWYISQANRVKTPLEAWTHKHISPTIVAASLSTVIDWASTQSQDEESRPLTIKSSPKGSELTASIAVDSESPPISLVISFPGSYPLESPTVITRTRVGVSEKNWQAWMRTIQIIIFSTGSIIEGLVAFRRNVQGALKGQSECAICYSIIGTDMQTPNKKCGTCKNMFHGTCLFRWFKSSNSSSCPLCRNNFNYA